MLFFSSCFAEGSYIREEGPLSVAAINAIAKSNLNKSLFWLMGPEGESITAERAWHGNRNRKPAYHISAHTQEAEKVNRKQAKAI